MGAWILVKVFASGCTALLVSKALQRSAGILEAGSGGSDYVGVVIIAILIRVWKESLCSVRYYGIVATESGAPGYQSVLSMLTAAVLGKVFFHDVTMFSVLLVLCLGEYFICGFSAALPAYRWMIILAILTEPINTTKKKKNKNALVFPEGWIPWVGKRKLVRCWDWAAVQNLGIPVLPRALTGCLK